MAVPAALKRLEIDSIAQKITGPKGRTAYVGQIDHDEERLVVLEGSRLIAHLPGEDQRRYLIASWSDRLLGGTRLAFVGHPHWSEGSNLSRFATLDLDSLELVPEVTRCPLEEERQYSGVDVDLGGRYVLLFSQFDDFPEIEVYDDQAGKLIRFGCDALIDTHLEELRWGAGRDSIRFTSRHTEGVQEISLDWKAKKARWDPKPVKASQRRADSSWL